MRLLLLVMFSNRLAAQLRPHVIQPFCCQFTQTGCHLVVLAGNHDSVATLKNRAISWRSSIRPWSPAPDMPANLASSRRDARRSAVPHSVLRPRDIITSQAGLNGIEKQHIYWQRLPIITNNTMPMPANSRRSASAHHRHGTLNDRGCQKSDAVRDIYIGTLDAFPAQNFHQPTTSRSGIFTAHRLLADGTCSLLRLSHSTEF